MINVRRKNNFLIDSAEDLYGESSVVCLFFLCVSLYETSHVFCTHILHISYEMYCNIVYFCCLPLVSVTLFNCSVGRSDCSRCRTADPKYGCVWCGGAASSRCVYQDSCTDEIKHTCPAPVIHFVSTSFSENCDWKSMRNEIKQGKN